LTDFYDKIVISDTSCLIAFTNIDRLDLLQTLCPSIITTPEVAAEYKTPLPQWVVIRAVKDGIRIKSINTLLGLGESSAIALALETENALLSWMTKGYAAMQRISALHIPVSLVFCAWVAWVTGKGLFRT
jgi:predicted nucleic acid-binding protein